MSTPSLSIEMLPALHGDALLLQYADGARTRRVLVDGGPIGAWQALDERVKALPAGDRHFELIVLTHVDTDHVDGLLRLFAQPTPWPFSVSDVWFNGWRHLEAAHGLLGGKQGEYFSALLARRLAADQWNGAFGGRPVVVPAQGPLPEKTLEGGLKLTLLSPTPATLDTMRDAWRKDIGNGFNPGDLDAAWQALSQQRRYLPGQGLLGSSPDLDQLMQRQSRPDDAPANGSSIALLAECGGKSVLLLADAHADVLSASLRRLLATRGLSRLKVDAVKVAHHGSKGNISDELLSLIDSRRYLFSTNGAQFQHPDAEAVQRVIDCKRRHLVTLYFNYRSDFTQRWDDDEQKKRLKYRTCYREDRAGQQSLVLTL